MAAEQYALAVNQHYGRGDPGQAILAAVCAAGTDPDSLTSDDLAPVTEFHSFIAAASRQRWSWRASPGYRPR